MRIFLQINGLSLKLLKIEQQINLFGIIRTITIDLKEPCDLDIAIISNETLIYLKIKQNHFKELF